MFETPRPRLFITDRSNAVLLLWLSLLLVIENSFVVVFTFMFADNNKIA